MAFELFELGRANGALVNLLAFPRVLGRDDVVGRNVRVLLFYPRARKETRQQPRYWGRAAWAEKPSPFASPRRCTRARSPPACVAARRSAVLQLPGFPPRPVDRGAPFAAGRARFRASPPPPFGARSRQGGLLRRASPGAATPRGRGRTFSSRSRRIAAAAGWSG